MSRPWPPPSNPAEVFDDLTARGGRPDPSVLEENAPPPRPVQASNPTVLPDGTVIPRKAAAPAGTGQFTVDLARAPHAIRELEDARDKLEELKKEALNLGNVRPPANDQVSMDAARVFGATAVGGAGSLVAAMDAGIKRLTQILNGLQTDLNAYTNTEDAARDIVTRSYQT